jgi:hypothetical protein
MSGADSKVSRKLRIPAGSTPWDSGELRGNGRAPTRVSLACADHHLCAPEPVEGRFDTIRLSGSAIAAGVGKGPAEGVQYQVEPELELVPEVVAGLHDVLGR